MFQLIEQNTGEKTNNTMETYFGYCESMDQFNWFLDWNGHFLCEDLNSIKFAHGIFKHLYFLVISHQCYNFTPKWLSAFVDQVSMRFLLLLVLGEAKR